MAVREKATESVGVAFRNFWPGFDSHFFFLELFASALGRDTHLVDSLDTADIVVSSVFQPRENKLERLLDRLAPRKWAPHASQLSIWYSGENIRPPHEEFDLCLSFDLDEFGGTNQYLPVAYLSVHWPWQRAGLSGYSTIETRRLGLVPSIEEISRPRKLEAERENFACMFVSNMTSDRQRLVEAIGTIGTVDVFGRDTALGPKPDKISVARNYRFMLCPENDLFPGYVTEKIVDAWGSGCVPIWWGDDAARLLNPSSHLNLAKVQSLRDLVGLVRNLDNDASRRRQAVNLPLANGVWSLDDVKSAIRRGFLLKSGGGL